MQKISYYHSVWLQAEYREANLQMAHKHGVVLVISCLILQESALRPLFNLSWKGFGMWSIHGRSGKSVLGEYSTKTGVEVR